MRTKIIAGNWKMYTSQVEAQELARAVVEGISGQSVLLFPPYVWLQSVLQTVNGAVGVGAQNCHYEKEGAFTGEIAPGMIKQMGCSSVLVGHSERRHGLGETDEFLNKKVKAALGVGLQVVFCIGELLSEREAGQTEAVLTRQIELGLANVDPAHLGNLVIAYEPVWAIGTGKVATPEQAQEAHAYIRTLVGQKFGPVLAAQIRILYGGSVKPDNAAGLMALPDVDGALVGGASLKAASFLDIVRSAG